MYLEKTLYNVSLIVLIPLSNSSGFSKDGVMLWIINFLFPMMDVKDFLLSQITFTILTTPIAIYLYYMNELHVV